MAHPLTYCCLGALPGSGSPPPPATLPWRMCTISTARHSCPSGALWACAGRPSAARCASSWFGLTTSPAPRLGRACDVLRA